MSDFRIDALLRPKSVAVVGASTREAAAGTRVLQNLQNGGFSGALYPVNPGYDEVCGLKCYPSLSRLPEKVDTAFLAVPAQAALEVLEELGGHGIGGAFVNASGFADAGAEGARRQEIMARTARRYGIAVCGPNNLGIINVHERVCLWTARTSQSFAPGPIALITQSGSVALALSQEHCRLGGLAYVVTTGNEAVCTAGHYLEAVIARPEVRVVMMFLETIRGPRLFARAAREAARLGKRIVVVKTGRSESASAAIAAHTGALAGDDQVYDAYFRHHGIIRARDLDEMVETVKLFTAYPDPPSTPHIGQITMSGGEASLIADLAEDRGLSLPDFSAATLERLRPAFPDYAQPRNPLDAWGLGWSVENFEVILGAIARDPQLGAIACGVDAPASGAADAKIALQMAEICAEMRRVRGRKVIFFNNTAAGGINPALERTLSKAGIPYLSGMAPALGALAQWSRYRIPDENKIDASLQRGEWRTRLADLNRLIDPERFRLMSEIGVPMADCIAVSSADEARAAAASLGYPVVMKGSAPNLHHKTESGLVSVGLRNSDQVATAFERLSKALETEAKGDEFAKVVVQPMIASDLELLIGVRNVAQFGSVVVVGPGGILVEIFREASLRMGPVDRETAIEMLNETRAGSLLADVRGRGALDLEAVADAVVALSQFGAAAQSMVSSVEINPLMVLERGKGVVGVDVVIEPMV